MSTIKCPNCGSTSQPQLVWRDTESRSTQETREYVCGCGCKFEAIFELKGVRILEIEAPFY